MEVYIISENNKFMNFLARKKTDEVEILNRENRFIYYLGTKPRFYAKLSYDTLRSSLHYTKQHCANNNVSRLSSHTLAVVSTNWSGLRFLPSFVKRFVTLILQLQYTSIHKSVLSQSSVDICTCI